MQKDITKEPNSEQILHPKSPVPVLGEGFSDNGNPDNQTVGNEVEESIEKDSKSKRRFWQLGKKKDDKSTKKAVETIPTSSSKGRSTSPFASSGFRSTSPQLQQAFGSPSSPGRTMQSSPRLHSPASSQIFERNVQEDTVPVATSPAIPSHITTENHIPPVLDASSMAITDDHLSPDTVEIVTHAAHQPAAVTVSGSMHPESTLSSPTIPEEAHFAENTEDTSTYGALDSADVRRLSFISFADVVHAEQAADGSMRDSLLLSGTSSIASPNIGARSPSPVRSPISPPLSASFSGENFKGLGLDASPSRKAGPGSPKSTITSSPTVTGELAIETMRQALRKTESGDLGAASRASISAL
jgi:hypothetical protein